MILRQIGFPKPLLPECASNILLSLLQLTMLNGDQGRAKVRVIHNTGPCTFYIGDERMESKQVQSSFKLLGTILGSAILLVGLIVMINSIINPMLGFVQDVAMGLTGVAIGAIIIYAARTLG